MFPLLSDIVYIYKRPAKANPAPAMAPKNGMAVWAAPDPDLEVPLTVALDLAAAMLDVAPATTELMAEPADFVALAMADVPFAAFVETAPVTVALGIVMPDMD